MPDGTVGDDVSLKCAMIFVTGWSRVNVCVGVGVGHDHRRQSDGGKAGLAGALMRKRMCPLQGRGNGKALPGACTILTTAVSSTSATVAMVSLCFRLNQLDRLENSPGNNAGAGVHAKRG